jgi:hypothetical protein
MTPSLFFSPRFAGPILSGQKFRTFRMRAKAAAGARLILAVEEDGAPLRPLGRAALERVERCVIRPDAAVLFRAGREVSSRDFARSLGFKTYAEAAGYYAAAYGTAVVAGRLHEWTGFAKEEGKAWRA